MCAEDGFRDRAGIAVYVPFCAAWLMLVPNRFRVRVAFSWYRQDEEESFSGYVISWAGEFDEVAEI